ncbi:hypothetical protein scyTo_0010376 [Scyliorhinus torazame]|uniref:Uncharacterized protein n=1 Tax=Scyliorhinus torazame TaxID=75743 RepID=A0A401P592_SCYTO|nr:hypothetical protein [Scyliorhinus torazame]
MLVKDISLVDTFQRQKGEDARRYSAGHAAPEERGAELAAQVNDLRSKLGTGFMNESVNDRFHPEEGCPRPLLPFQACHWTELPPGTAPRDCLRLVGRRNPAHLWRDADVNAAAAECQALDVASAGEGEGAGSHPETLTETQREGEPGTHSRKQAAKQLHSATHTHNQWKKLHSSEKT